MVAERIFTTFNFLVQIDINDGGDFKIDDVCKAAFSECDGLEMTMEPKTFQQGGANTEQVHLAGPVTYSQLTLKRGMSKDFGLWRWFTETMKTKQRGLRGQATITFLDGAKQPQIIFQLKDCLPTKLRAPTLNAADGGIAIEEMQLVYAGMTVEFPTSEGGAGTPGLNLSTGISANANVGINAGVGINIQGGLR